MNSSQLQNSNNVVSGLDRFGNKTTNVKSKKNKKDVSPEETGTGLTDWNNEPTLEMLKSDYRQAHSANQDMLSNIEKWDELLHIKGTAKVKKIDGRSSVQPRVIRKSAEWRYSALSEPFLSSEDIFTINPKTWLDVEAAKQNELVLNYQFNNQLNKIQLVDNMVRSVVDFGTYIARVSWEYEEAYKTQNTPNFHYDECTDPQMAQQIMQATQMYQQQNPQFVQLPEELQESAKATIENKRPIIAIKIGEVEEDVKTIIKNQPKVDMCDLRNVFVDPTCHGILDNAGFIVYAFESSLSELTKLGIYKNLDKIEVEQHGADGYTYLKGDLTFQYQDKARKKFVVYEYWGYYDIDDSGTTTPIVATWVGDTMIRLEKNPYPDAKIPFVIIPYMPVKNSVYGEPDALLLEDNQKLTGALTRGMIDTLARSANGQIGMRKDALDAINRRKFKQGLDYEFNPNVDPSSAVISHTYPELPQTSHIMLQYFAQEAEALTGIKSYAQGLSGDSYAGQTAAGIQGTLTATGKRESSILRRLSKGLEEIAHKILAMNSEWLSDDEVIRITDESFIAINRQNLAGRFDIKLSINTPESNAAKAQELSFMLQTMAQMLPFDLTKIILAEIAHLQNMPELADTLRKYQPPPDPMQQINMQKAQVEIQQMQAQIQISQADAQHKSAQAQKTMAQVAEVQAQTKFLEVQAQQLQSGIQHQNNMELAQAQSEGNMKRDIAKQVLNSKLKK